MSTEKNMRPYEDVHIAIRRMCDDCLHNLVRCYLLLSSQLSFYTSVLVPILYIFAPNVLGLNFPENDEERCSCGIRTSSP